MAAATVLIADDHAVSTQLLAHCLASAGFRVLSAQDGREALSLMEAESPSLVVLDVMMPVMDGLEVMRRAQTDERPLDSNARHGERPLSASVPESGPRQCSPLSRHF